MKTLDEIVNNYEEWSVFLDDRFGVRLAQFLTQEQLEKIGFKWNSDEPYPEPKEWTRENILVQLKEDVEFGFEKALDRRGISASLMFAVVLRWNRVLEEGLEDYPEDNYAMYLPLFKATAIKVIAEALEEYENNFNHKISILESKIILYEKERKAIIRHLKEGNIELLKSYFGIEKMKEYYLIKCRNNIPFIIGQYDTEEDARKAKNRENPNSELMIVVNIEKDKPEKTS